MILSGKKILVLGLANKKSIAWGVIQELRKAGAQVGIVYFQESNEKRVRPLANEAEADFFLEVDVTKDEDLLKLKDQIYKDWKNFDGLVHSIAFSPAEEFERPFHQCTRDGFFKTLDVSAYSLISLTNTLKEFFNPEFSIIAMTYYGSQKALGGYNLMGVAKAALESIVRYLALDLGKQGVRVNCISAGPIKTLASLGIPKFHDFLDNVENHSPLGENVTTEDVGNLASFLLSNQSKHMTGQVLFVDSGMSIIVR